MNKTISTFLLVFLCFCIFGCSKKNSNTEIMEDDMVSSSYSDYGAVNGAVSYAMEESSTDNYYSKAVSDNSVGSPSTPRMVQQSASLSISVPDPVQSMNDVIQLASEMGGFVVDSSSGQTSYNDVTFPYASITLRVPAERLNETLERIESLTTDKDKYVTAKQLSGVDITSDYVDSQSRLTSMEKTLNKLYEILDTAQTAEEALSVYEEISSVESDMEVLKGQIKYMEESVSLSSIDVRINAIRPDTIISESPWAPLETIQNAWKSLINGAKVLFQVLIYLVIVFVPLAAIIGVPLFFIIRAVHKNKKTKKGAARKDSDSDPSENQNR